MNNFFKNWKTTSAGIVMCVGAVAMYLSDKTKLIECVTAFLAGVGLMFAGDASQNQN